MENIFYTIIITTVSCFLACGIFLIIKILKNAHENEIYRKKYINNIHDDFDIKNDIHDKYNIYIQPYISKHSFSQAGKPQLLRDYFIKQVFIKNTEEPRVFCILGDTGTGKTAALVHLYHDYIKKRTRNNPPYDIHFVSLRQKEAFQTIEKIEKKSNCILLLDAIDENQMAQEPKESKEYKSFFQQLEKAYIDFAFVVTTCRPQFFANEDDEFNTSNIPTTKLYLLPFNDGQISEYLDKLFSFRSDNELRHKAELLIHKYPFITTRPLVLTYIREIVESNRNINTAFDLYDAIVNNSIRRDLNKITPQINNKDITSWWNVLYEVASYLYSNKKNILTSKELQSIISKSTNTNDIIKNYFQQRSLLTRTGNEFHFSDKSFYEYFMAYRFLQYPEEIKQVYGMDFALQIYDDALQAWSEKKDTPFADLKNTRPYTVASSLNSVGVALDDINHFSDAERYYKLALEQFRHLEKEKNDTCKDDIAMVLNNLAILHNNTNQYKDAEEEYNEALTIRRQLAEQNPDEYLPNVATTLNNLANLHSNTNQLEKAEEEYNEALTIRRQLADKNPDAFLPNVATTLNNLANLHCNTNQYKEAEEEYNEALTIRRQLADNNPDDYLPDVAMTLNNLAILHRNTNRLQEANEEYNEALNTYRQLADKNPDAYLPDFANTLENLAILHCVTDRLQDAEEEYKDVLSIRQKLADKYPNAYLHKVAQTLFNMARMHLDRKEYPAAEDAAQESLEKYRIMAEKSHAAFDPKVKKAEELLERIRKAKEADA